MFIAFEGLDGSGKTTQQALFAEFLRERGFDVVETREPGGTPVAEKIREILLGELQMDYLSDILMFAAARRDHVTNVIEPALELGKVVLCDRYVDSTLAYQGFNEVAQAQIKQVNTIAVGKKYISPDLSIFLDADPETAFDRSTARDREKGWDWFNKVYERYDALINQWPVRWLRVDCPWHRSIETVQATIQFLFVLSVAENKNELVTVNKQHAEQWAKIKSDKVVLPLSF